MVVAVAALVAPTALAADTAFQQAVKAYNAKNYRDAYNSFELCLKKSPSDVNALYYEALCCHQLRDVQGARLRYQRIIDIASDSPAAGLARTALSSIEAASGKPAPSVNNANATAVSHGGENPGAAQPEQPGSAEAAATAAEMASLPDRASFYFTHEPGGHMGVTVAVNNHQMPALFDTGAGAFFYRDQLQAAGVDCNRAVRGGFTHGWAGTPVPIYSMDADIKLGTLTRRIRINFQDAGSGLNQNLIGQSFIQGYQYEIDDKGGRVDLKKSIEKSDQKIDSMYDIPLKVVNDRDIIQIEVDGHKVDTFIDTGAVYSIMSQKTANQCGVESTGTQQLMGVGGGLSVGIANAKVRLGPIYKEFTLRIGGSGGNCIGQDFMEGWRFKIDREHGLLRFFH